MASSVIDLLLFHTMERNLYSRLVHKLGTDPETTKEVVALWLWMETIGHLDLVRHIYAHEDDVLLRIVAEGKLCIEALNQDANSPTGQNDIPITASLVNEPINLRFFRYCREVATDGIYSVLHNVCSIIFDDNIMRLAARDTSHPANQRVMSAGLVRPPTMPSGEGIAPVPPGIGSGSIWDPSVSNPPLFDGSSTDYSSATASIPTRISSLNPFAKPWSPVTEQESEDLRSMFLTFSRGYPLTKEDVLEFFTNGWGDCVESVELENPVPPDSPMFGRIVFNTLSVIPSILNGQQKAKFVVKGKHLWARMYVPKKPRE